MRSTSPPASSQHTELRVHVGRKPWARRQRAFVGRCAAAIVIGGFLERSAHAADLPSIDVRVGADGSDYIDTNAVADLQVTHPLSLGASLVLDVGGFGQVRLSGVRREYSSELNRMFRFGAIARLHFYEDRTFDPFVGLELGVAHTDVFLNGGPSVGERPTYPDVALILGFDVHAGPVLLGLHIQATTALDSPYSQDPSRTEVIFPYFNYGAHVGARF